MIEPLKVFRLDGGTEQPVPWAGSAVSVAWRVNELPRAEIDVALAEGFGVDTGAGVRPLQEVLTNPADGRLRDDEIYRVRTDRGLGAPDDVLFDGFIERVAYGVDARGRRATLRMVHVADVLRAERRYQVLGQLWLDRAGIEGLTASPPTHTLSTVAPREVPALECVFNPRGRKNCYKDLLRPESTGAIECDYLPVFTWPHKPDANWWNWARVLLYLLGVARLEIAGSPPVARLGELTAHKFVELPAADGKTLTQRIIEAGYHASEPDDPAQEPDEPWARALLGRPNGHSIEALDWLTAWRYTLARCGLIWSLEPTDMDGVRWGLRVEHPDELQALEVRLPTPGWKSHDKPWEETLARAANVSMLDLQADYDLVNSLGPSGAEDRREITVELVPGWRKNDDWDVNPASGEAVNAALAKLATPEWEDKYTLHGLGTNPLADAGLWNVGRLWGLNTHGAWNGYGRDWGPWIKPQPPTHPGAYKAFDLADVRLARQHGEPPVFVQGESTLRPRALGNCLSGLTSRTPLPPIVEVSFDEGAHWRVCTAGAEASTWDLRVWLGADDPRAETQTNPAWPNPGMSLPEAYIRGKLRLRVTATIGTDTRFGYGGFTLTGHTISRRERHRVLQRPQQWAMARRDDYEGMPMGNSLLNVEWNQGAPLRPVPGERDDYTVAERDMRRLLHATDRVVWRGAVEIPWLQYVAVDVGGAVTDGYRPAAALIGLACESDGEPVRPELYRLEFRAAVPEGAVGALIGEVVWNYRQDPPAASTRLHLEDRSRLVNAGGWH